MRRPVSGELILALGLFLAAVGVDFLWVRPQQGELHRLSARKQTLERRIQQAEEQRRAEEAILAYGRDAAASAAGAKTPGGDATSTNPLALLESLRRQARLRSLDVSLDRHESDALFERTTYFMSVYGAFTRQIQFLKALETARPLVSVDAFTMDTRQADPKVTLQLNMTVYTPARRPAP